jgi:hypothetical protein
MMLVSQQNPGTTLCRTNATLKNIRLNLSALFSKPTLNVVYRTDRHFRAETFRICFEQHPTW